MRFKKFFNESKVSYSAVVIDDESRRALLQNNTIAQHINPDHEVIAHHMTIKLGGIAGTAHEARLGKAEEFVATHIGTYDNGNLVAVLVTGISDNKNPHITISLNRNAGVKPKDSNLITNWEPLQEPVPLKGAVLEL